MRSTECHSMFFLLKNQIVHSSGFTYECWPAPWAFDIWSGDVTSSHKPLLVSHLSDPEVQRKKKMYSKNWVLRHFTNNQGQTHTSLGFLFISKKNSKDHPWPLSAVSIQDDVIYNPDKSRICLVKFSKVSNRIAVRRHSLSKTPL